MKRSKILALLLALVMISAFVAACAGDPAAPEPAGVLRLGTAGIDGRFTSITASNVYDMYVVNLVFDPLIRNDAEGVPIPWLATGWTVSDDNLVYTFEMDPRATFSDGTPVTASDVVFTYNTIAHENYDGPRRANIANMEMPGGVVAVDDHTVAFHFLEPSPVNIWDTGFGIMPEHIYGFEDWYDFLDLELTPVGSGRFTFVEWLPMQHVRVAANTDHWHPDRVPQVSEVLMMDVPDEVRVEALATDQIDFSHLSTLRDNYLDLRAAEGDGVGLTMFTDLGYQFLQFNTLLPQLEDHRVRQALLYALDRQAYIDTMLGPELGRVATAPIPPVSWAFPPNEDDLNTYDLDLDRARELMAEAGFEPGDDGILVNADGVRMEILWPVYTEVAWPGVMAELAADTWGQIGVDLTIELTDFGTVAAMTFDTPPEEREFGVFVMGFSLAIDPDPFGGLFCGVNIATGDFNSSGFSHARANELVEMGRTEFDIAVRAPIYWEWGILMNYYVPTVIIAYREVLWGVRDNVNGLVMNTFQDWTYHVHEVTIDEVTAD